MALKSELEENPFEPPIDDDFLKTALEYRDNFENDEAFREALAVWPRCPDCGRRRVTRCPVCKTSGTLFPLGDNNFWDFRSDEEKARDAELFDEEENFGCSCGCGRSSAAARRQNRAWADVGRSKRDGESESATRKSCGGGGGCGDFCGCGSEGNCGDAETKPQKPENLFEKGLVAVCYVCSEAFVPKFLKRCEWCDFEFPDGEEPAESSETPADILAFLARRKAEDADDFLDRPASPRLYWTLAALGVGALLFCAYFAFLFR